MLSIDAEILTLVNDTQHSTISVIPKYISKVQCLYIYLFYNLRIVFTCTDKNTPSSVNCGNEKIHIKSNARKLYIVSCYKYPLFYCYTCFIQTPCTYNLYRFSEKQESWRVIYKYQVQWDVFRCQI